MYANVLLSYIFLITHHKDRFDLEAKLAKLRVSRGLCVIGYEL